MKENFSNENPKKVELLYVDDEANNLSAFKAVFRREYKIYTTTSVEEAWKIIDEKQNIQIIISDQRMPKITGTTFLKRVAKKYPDIIRVLLTGYSDIEDIIDAINEAEIFRYVSKPWEKDKLHGIIEQGIEVYKLKQEQKQLIENLEKDSKELDHFLYGATHDLRAPVASLIGLVDLAKRENDMQGVKMILEMQSKTLKQMEELVEDVVNYSKNKYAAIEVTPIDFSTLLQNSLDVHEAYQNAQELKKNINLEINADFESDISRIKVIFNNLISNAIRYSDFEKETSEINVFIETNEKEAIIKVEDNGVGIETEHLPNIFEMFYRANEQQKGSGLGLFLVKESVNALKGEIEVKSEEGKGTEFQVTLPNLKNANL